MNIIKNEKDNLVWEANLENYSAKTKLQVCGNCMALCIVDGQKERSYIAGEELQINRRFGHQVQVIVASCESFDIIWGCFVANLTNSRIPGLNLGMNGKLTAKLSNLNVFFENFSEIINHRKVDAVNIIRDKLIGSITDAAKETLLLVAKYLRGSEPDRTMLKVETEDKFKQIFTRYGMAVVSSDINGVQSQNEKIEDDIDEYSSEENELNKIRRELENVHVCSVCGNIYEGNRAKCSDCGAVLN